MPLVDANIILRYLLNDHPVMSPKAKETIIGGVETTAEVLAEVVYVLKSVYKVDRLSISASLESFVQEVTVPHKAAVLYACRLFGIRSLDFVDCLLAGYHYMDGSIIMTFDEKPGKTLKINPLVTESSGNAAEGDKPQR